MTPSQTDITSKSDQREAARAYLHDMLGQMAVMARRAGQRPIAILLEAIIAAHWPKRNQRSV